ncbi:MAG TPA: AMP-binding protein, partial [Accumulibacter sp.]|nr:AMP-binding protein [Accumulibacter sp.]
MQNIYNQGLDKNTANYTPLTPLTFIARTAYIYPERTAVIHGQRRFTWLQTYTRVRRLASALADHGIGEGDTVAVMLNNTPEMIECHFGVPVLGAVLNTLNTRLDAETIAFMLEHGEAKVLITDREYSPTVKKALAGLQRPLIVIDVD